MFLSVCVGTAAADDDYVSSYENRAALRIRQDRMYSQRRMLVYYAIFDMCRERDSLNPNSHSDIMVPAPPGRSHAYLYGHVLAVIHVNVNLAGRGDDLYVMDTLVQPGHDGALGSRRMQSAGPRVRTA